MKINLEFICEQHGHVKAVLDTEKVGFADLRCVGCQRAALSSLCYEYASLYYEYAEYRRQKDHPRK